MKNIVYIIYAKRKWREVRFRWKKMVIWCETDVDRASSTKWMYYSDYSVRWLGCVTTETKHLCKKQNFKGFFSKEMRTLYENRSLGQMPHYHEYSCHDNATTTRYVLEKMVEYYGKKSIFSSSFICLFVFLFSFCVHVCMCVGFCLCRIWRIGLLLIFLKHALPCSKNPKSIMIIIQ